MARRFSNAAVAFALTTAGDFAAAAADNVPVTVDNFVRAESDLYFAGVIKSYGFGKFGFERTPTPIDKQTNAARLRQALYVDADHQRG
ncbi:MAG TPA: hypothetical protein VKD02_00065 [Methyloceanibacter sp.]|nr:hypothetical protein [Methyloceanibacter sp.]